MTKHVDVAIIGGGAAGYFCAIQIAQHHKNLSVMVLEATQRPLLKVALSGGGRCNVTHHQFDPYLLSQSYPRGAKALLQAFSRFQARDTVAWFEAHGVPLKVEADGRMFPVSNSSQSVITCLTSEAQKAGIHVQEKAVVSTIERHQEYFQLVCRAFPEGLKASHVVLATGSSPLGHKLAQSLGHNIIAPVPSLFSFTIKDTLFDDMAGVSFPKVTAKLVLASESKNKTYQQTGPMLITHWGLSGPAILKLSAFAARDLHASRYTGSLHLNFMDASSTQVKDDLLAWKTAHGEKKLTQQPFVHLSKRFWQQILSIHKLSTQELWAEKSRQTLEAIADSLTAYKCHIIGKGEFKDEFVTAGGVDLKEVNFKTLESKLVAGLYFAGEVLDVDGITGGFNFQNAWTTAAIAAKHIANR